MPAYDATLYLADERKPHRSIQFLAPSDQHALTQLRAMVGVRQVEIWLADRLVALLDGPKALPGIKAVLARRDMPLPA